MTRRPPVLAVFLSLGVVCAVAALPSSLPFGTKPDFAAWAATTKPDFAAWNSTTKPDFAAWNGTNPCAATPKWRPAADVQESWSLTGRVAVVTGASSGIGAAVGAALAAEGATVIGTSRNPAAAGPAPFDLLPLELTDPASVAAFGEAVAAHPAVVARGGIDILINNAGRAVLGPVGPPPTISDYPAWLDGVWEGLQTNYMGAIRVTNTLWPLLEARAGVEDTNHTDGGGLKAALKKKEKKGGAHYARVVYTASPLAWATSADVPDLWAYTASQRSLIIYANMLRAAVTAAAGVAVPPSPASSKVKLSVLAPMATSTRLVEPGRPIFLDPASTDPAFAAFLADLRAATAAGLDPAWVARAYVQVLKEDEPIANAAVGAPSGTLPPSVTVVPGSPTDRVAPQAVTFPDVLDAENADAAVVAIPPKRGAAVASGITEKLQGLQTALDGRERRRRRLASTLKDDVETWVEEERVPCVALPVFYPSPKFDALAAAKAGLAGSVAVVVGASGPPNKGVGRALADQLTAAGVTVIGTSRNPADPANAGIKYDLLPLDMSDQASVDAFAAAVAAHPAVRAKGLATLFLNAARFAAGVPGPPPLQDEAMYYAGTELSQQTNFLGPLRVTHALWPLLEAYGARAGPASKPAGPRLIWTASAESYATGGADPLSYSYWSYGAAKRASLAYYNALLPLLRQQPGSNVTAAVLYPFGINTRLVEGTRPIFLSPVDGSGDPVGDPYFLFIMRLYRFFLNTWGGLDPSFVAAADVELATEADPPPNVASSSWAWKPHGDSRLGGLQDIWDPLHQIEELQSAFPFEVGKAAAAKKG